MKEESLTFLDEPVEQPQKEYSPKHRKRLERQLKRKFKSKK